MREREGERERELTDYNQPQKEPGRTGSFETGKGRENQEGEEDGDGREFCRGNPGMEVSTE